MEQIEKIRNELGLDDPLIVQYGNLVKGIVTGDLGTSLYSTQTVTAALGQALPVTLSLAAIALVMVIVIGGSFGILAGMRPGGVLDRAPHLDHLARSRRAGLLGGHDPRDRVHLRAGPAARCALRAVQRQPARVAEAPDPAGLRPGAGGDRRGHPPAARLAARHDDARLRAHRAGQGHVAGAPSS